MVTMEYYWEVDPRGPDSAMTFDLVCMYVHRQFIERRKGRVPAKPLYKVTIGRTVNGA